MHYVVLGYTTVNVDETGWRCVLPFAALVSIRIDYKCDIFRNHRRAPLDPFESITTKLYVDASTVITHVMSLSTERR